MKPVSQKMQRGFEFGKKMICPIQINGLLISITICWGIITITNQIKSILYS